MALSKRSLFFLFLALAFLASLAGASPAQAQRPDLFAGPYNRACQENPNSEECICRDSIARALQPAAEHWEVNTFPPRLKNYYVGVVPSGERIPDSSSPKDIFRQRSDGTWFDTNGGAEPNLEYNRDFFQAGCAHDYLEENLTRGWHFAVALAAAFFALSVAWAGVMHMQELATGQRNTMVRQIIARATIGLLLLALSYVIWRAVSQAIWGVYF